ncbi:PP2C family serine/threonine-protein phosphatase [Cryptosporangium phraense]|uniref:Serine/threonine protein phosphatase n=1 Tax=Cryptosporangium phraense TaxID=2593070 RepID=A0A545AH48_9ACTN|nr:protein phosphatase 2C domain-containing protein [Cryptosporangium phraense]TQS40643.1 serine/threonine protein phosphatase [Cryptosporangium phraense]
MTVACPECAHVADDADVFCEACGTELAPPPRSEARVWASSAVAAGECGHCGAAPASEFCPECGRRTGAGRDRSELALPGVGAVTDRGHRRSANEDAIAVGADDGVAAAIVCDGISTSPRADVAAVAAVEAGLPAALRAVTGGMPPAGAVRAGFARAFTAVDALTHPSPSDPAPVGIPSCTYVTAIVTADGFAVGWLGDSRAYWVPADGDPRLLTVDDALPESDGGALTHWVGADAPDDEIHVVTEQPDGPGVVVLCSDGLWRYLAGPSDLAPIAVRPPADGARLLVDLALERGGADNVAVAVLVVARPEGETA